jgi:hypothetical protein
MSYQKFIQRLQRVLPKQWRPSEVIWMNGKAKRQPAYWEGLRVLPCFVDLALSDDDDQKPSNRPHVPNWICVKENCQDGGLTDLTATLHTLHSESLRDAKISDEMTRDCIEENVVLDETGSKVCKSRLTPTFESVDDGCKVSKVCKADDLQTSAQPPSKTLPPPAAEFKAGDRVQVRADYITPELCGQQAVIVKYFEDDRYQIDFGCKIKTPYVEPKRFFCINKKYFHHVTDGEQLELPF